MFYKIALVCLLGIVKLASAIPLDSPTEHDRLIRLSTSINWFGIDLLRNMEQRAIQSKKLQNICISPLSVSSVLATLLAGTAEETHRQIFEALRYGPEHLNEHDALSTYHELRHILNQQLRHTKNVLNVVDAVAIQQSSPIKKEFKEVLEHEIIFHKDFHHEAHRTTEEINHWISEQTHHLIPKFFDEDLSSETVLVLLNAINFKGMFSKSFNKELTKKAPFHYFGEDGHRKVEEVETMFDEAHYPHASFDDGELLEIPYDGEKTSLLIFLPKEHKEVSPISNSLLTGNFSSLADRISKLKQHKVKLHLPKFKFDSSHSLNEELKHMGIRDAFEQQKANLSPIDGKRDLYVSKVQQKTAFEVSEEGTKAAAETDLLMKFRSMIIKDPSVSFVVDRPFFFAILDKTLKLVLFEGVVNKP